MHSVVLAPLFFLMLGAAPGQQDARQTADPARKCPTPVLTAAAPENRGLARKLNELPDAALIATVDTRVDGCPVMLVLDGGGTGASPGWTPAPGGDHRPID